jgi:two-component system, sensor histidine kinase and response regulator
MTADALQGDRERCLAAGMDDYITKPVTLESLRAALARWLQPTAAPTSAPSVIQRANSAEADKSDWQLPAQPRAMDDPSADPGERHALVGASSSPTVARNGRLLLVDDNRTNQHLMTLQLARLGCAVDVAANGREALAKLGERDYTLILMDCNMPVMDGYEATERIRELETQAGSGRHVPIIAVTANALRGDREKCLRAGMDEYVAKPVKLPELRAAISPWVEVADAGSGPPSVEQPPLAQVGESESLAEPRGWAPIDEAQLEAIRALQVPGEPDVLAQVLDEYAQDAKQLVRQLRQAVEDGDLAVLHRAAHSLKSSSAYVGAQALSAMCDDLDQLCKSALDGEELGIPEGAAALVAQIEAALSRVLSVLGSVAQGPVAG